MYKYIKTFIFFSLSIIQLHGQASSTSNPLVIVPTDEGPYFNHPPTGPDNKVYAPNTKAEISIDLEEIEPTKNYAIFFSDAELQSIQVSSKLYHLGKYQNTNKLQRKWDDRHLILSGRDLINTPIKFSGQNISKKEFIVSPKIFPATRIDQSYVQLIAESKPGILFTIAFLGAILVFLLYTSGLAIQNKNNDFRFYSYYLGAILLHNIIQADAYLKIFAFFPKNPIWYHYINEFIQMFIYAFFMLFIRVFLELDLHHPKLNRFVNKSILATVIFGFIFLAVSMITKDFHFVQNYLSILWIIVAALGTIIVISVYKQSNRPTRYYIMAGSVFLLIGSILELVSSLNLYGGYNWNLFAAPVHGWQPFNYTQLAILLETICFALGIGFKIREIEKSNQQNIELEVKALDMELTALRSQMNPHFLFNSLSSVNDYIMHENPKQASKYLTKFARLMRVILNNSKKKLIPIQEEINAINLYVELEQLRFENKFGFDLDIDPALNLNQILIPSMLIQPYIENAIKHGFLHLDKKGQLSVKMKRKESKLHIEICDNGIGRIASLALKNQHQIQRVSHGMEITSDRIQLLNRIYGLDASLKIVDLENGGEAQGTQIILELNTVENEIKNERNLIGNHH